jgi:hypothetical protein
MTVSGGGTAVEAPDTARGYGETPIRQKFIKSKSISGRAGIAPRVIARRDVATVSGRHAPQATVAGQQQLTPAVTGRTSPARIVARRGRPVRFRPKGW